MSADLPMHRTSASASDRRSGPLAAPHPSSLDIPKRYGGGSVFDLYALVYVSDPDSSLLCPICHDPLVDPVTTPCDHTFCYRCLRRSIASSPSGTTCPIDRDFLSWLDCFSAARLIHNQLNGLVVRCPYHGRGCSRELRREAVESHAMTECRYKDYSCPDTDCDKKMSYKPRDDVCPHKEKKSCPHCDVRTVEAELDAHFLSCPGAKTRCLGCWQLMRRSQMDAHRELECDGIEVPCPHQDVGCSVRTMRGEMSSHSRMCAFHPDTPSGIVIRAQRDLIQSYGDLGSQLREVKARQAESDRRIDELAVTRRHLGTDSIANDNRTMQDLDAGFEEVHQNLTQLEARQSMWTLNQVMPIREEVTELRNNINMIRMHVNWLLNRSREEGRTRAANNTGSSASIRRVDSTGEAAPVLPERRRSSGTEMDLPRL
ncbi:TRAF-type zinc finger domain-containing protein [Hirsutella rhossiliensis]|uniref:TRAF-type zinc finger domain-containing protein n=1 Tax=Hirsutella rhossiliensis TaxID=111463 RepID=A0A9P8N3Y8_9HYPO|nr:TRAF-type zinc finger domain-containing protein [Hirsutella rhossiliensis]KAH0966384.1 TRAF-type zinc finger domain-containing protein [Hirsutella rhossiliensis]